MKFLHAYIVAVCFAGVYAVEPVDLPRNDELECAKQHNVDAEKMAHMKPTPDFVPTRDVKCYAACIMKKANMLGSDGKFTENFNNEKEMAIACPPQYGADECETVGNLMKCLMQHDLAEKMRSKVRGGN